MSGYFDPLPKSNMNQAKILKWVQEQVNTFYRSITFTGGDVTIGGGGSLSLGGTVPGGASGQFFLHNSSNHLTMFETDDPDYPDMAWVEDVNALAARFLWVDGRAAPLTYIRAQFLSPTHATRAHDIDFLDSNNDPVLRWDDSLGTWVSILGTAAAPALAGVAGETSGIYFAPDATEGVGITVEGAKVAAFRSTPGHGLEGLAWTTWTPTLTNLTVGSGTQSARYVQIGNTVFVQYRFTFGAGSSIAGGVAISVPVTPQSSVITTVGGVEFNDANGNDFVGTVVMNNTSLFPQRVTVSGSDLIRGGISSTTPFTWASGDVLAFTAVYEAA